MSDQGSFSTLHINTSREWRGGERQTLLLAEGLHTGGHRTRVVCPPNSELEQRCRDQGIPVLPLKMRGEADLTAIDRLRRWIREETPDLVHTHTAHAHTLGGLARWGLGPLCVAQRRVPFSILRSGTPIVTPWKYRRLADHLIAISEQVARVLEGDEIPADHITVIPDGVPPLPEPKISPTQWRQQFRIPDQGLLIGSVGQLSREKGHVHLIEALTHLDHRSQPVQLVLVGEGPEKLALSERARALGMHGRVHFTGFQSDVSSATHALDLYVQPSLEEGLGTSILDALQACRPVVASQVGGIPEVIIDGETGRLAPAANPAQLAEAIDSLLDDREGAITLARAGQQRATQHYSQTALIDGNLQLYTRLLQEQRAGRR